MPTSGLEGVKIPSFFLAPGQALQQAQVTKDRREEREYRRGLEQQEKQDRNRLFNLRQIDDATAFDKFKVGQQVIDNYTLKQLSELKNKALTDWVNLSPAEVQYRLTQEMTPLMQWDEAAKTAYKGIENSLKDVNKTYPNINISKAHDVLMNQFADDFMRIDNEGRVSAKNPLEIKQRDYSALLNDSNILGQITDDTSPFFNYIQGLKPTPVQGKDYTNKRGFVNAYKYKGQLSPLSELVTDDDNRPSGTRLKSENIDLGGGRSLEMLPQQEFENLMSIPAVKASALSMWSKVKPRIEEDFVSKNKRPIDPNTEEMLFRGFLRDQIKPYDISYVGAEEVEKTPKISINAGSSTKGNQGAEWARDMKIAANQDRSKPLEGQENVKRVAAYLFGGNTRDKYNDVFIVPASTTGGKDQIQVNYTIKNDSNNAGEDTQTYQRIDVDDPYLEEKLVGIYQQMTGSDTKAEKVPFYKEKTGGTKTTVAPKVVQPAPAKSSTSKWDKYKRQ